MIHSFLIVLVFKVIFIESLIPISQKFSSCINMDCSDIKEILIPENVDICTTDLPVFIKGTDKIKTMVFLTASGSLKLNSQQVECHNQKETFILNNIELKRLNNKVSIETTTTNTETAIVSSTMTTTTSLILTSKLNQYIGISPENTVLTKLQRSSYLEDLYIKYVDKNEIVKMIRDIFEFSVCLLVLFYCIYLSKDFPEAIERFKIFLINKKHCDDRQEPNLDQVIIEVKDPIILKKNNKEDHINAEELNNTDYQINFN